MKDYKKESPFWLMEHVNKVAYEIGGHSAGAIVAIQCLFSSVDGATAFREMKIDLTADEWDKLYHLCDCNTAMLISSVIAINTLSDYNVAHANLRLEVPAQFVTEPIRENIHLMVGSEKWRLEKRLREEFLARYRLAKVDQPKPNRFIWPVK